MPNKIGILTYYWPPSGGSGVQRWLKFSNKLSHIGNDVHVFTFKNSKYPVVDNDLSKKIKSNIKVNYISGFELPNFITSRNSKPSESFGRSSNFIDILLDYTIVRILLAIREFFFFPDSRKYLISSAVKYISDYNEKHSLDCLITTGPPHSMHLAGLQLKKEFNIKWISDFRDPWSNFFQNKLLNKFSSTQLKHEKKEKEVVEFSDAVFTTSESLKNRFQELNKNTHCIHSGYEKLIEPKSHDKFRILYAGSMKLIQNPKNLWIALHDLISSGDSFKEFVEITLIGNINDEIFNTKEFKKIRDRKIISYMSKEKLNHEISISELLIICSVNLDGSGDIIPGKFFHYYSSGKKMIAITQKGSDLEKIIDENNTGKSFEFQNTEDLKRYIINCFNDYVSGLKTTYDIKEKYLTSNIAKNISEIISKI
tara:strand:- start:8 stop:1282 length:1275 start_codon:yes stop_codon:yes gene_type:complete